MKNASAPPANRTTAAAATIHILPSRNPGGPGAPGHLVLIGEEVIGRPFAYRKLSVGRGRRHRRHRLGAGHFLRDRLFGRHACLVGGGSAKAEHLRANFFEFRDAALIGFPLDRGDFRLQSRVGLPACPLGLFAQAGLCVVADEGRFGLDRARGFFFGGGTQLACFLFTPRGGFALRLFERTPRLVCFLPHANELGLDAGVGLGAQFFDGSLEGARR